MIKSVINPTKSKAVGNYMKIFEKLFTLICFTVVTFSAAFFSGSPLLSGLEVKNGAGDATVKNIKPGTPVGSAGNRKSEDYSVSINDYWDEKVPYSKDKLPVNEDPFEYWLFQGNRKLKDIKKEMTSAEKIYNYRNAISNLYSALHYKPEKIMTMLSVAETYQSIGKEFITNGAKENGEENFLISIRLYEKSMSKTDLPENELIKIRDNLKAIEELLNKS